MLPLALSADACSLAPGVERLAVTAEIVLGADGDGAVGELLSQPDPLRPAALLRRARRVSSPAAPRRREPIAEPLDARPPRRRGAARAPRRRRRSRSRPPSPSSSSTPTATSSRPRSVEQTEAHGLIEQLMILTNERVAEHCERRRVPTLYRVHERPDPARVAALVEQARGARRADAAAAGRARRSRRARPASWSAEASRLVAREAERRGHGRAAYTSLVLRSLSPPSTRDRNLGHAGLGSPAYCALHLADPPLPGPDRPPRPALGDSAPARTSPSAPRSARRPRGARSASARRC